MKPYGLNAIAISPLILALSVGALAAAPQDGLGAATQEVTPGKRLAAAIAAITAHDTLLRGSVSHDEPDAGGMGGGTMIIAGGSGASSPPFAGELEVFRSSGGELLIASESDLPSVVYFDDGDVMLTETLFGSETVDVADVTQDMSQLLDLERLARSLAKTECDARVDEESGIVTIDGSLSKRYIKGSGGIMASFSPQILGVDFRAQLAGDGTFIGVEFDVTRSDPMAGIRERAMSGELSGGAVEMSDPSEFESDEEGRISTYSVSVADGKLTDRGTAALARMRKAAEIEAKR